jgi:hypothetical protein
MEMITILIGAAYVLWALTYAYKMRKKKLLEQQLTKNRQLIEEIKRLTKK